MKSGLLFTYQIECIENKKKTHMDTRNSLECLCIINVNVGHHENKLESMNTNTSDTVYF